jgi:hypothetical protein
LVSCLSIDAVRSEETGDEGVFQPRRGVSA